MAILHFKHLTHLMSNIVDKTKMYVDMEQSKAYSESRPRYTDKLFKTIADYCKETNPDLDLAVDVGCGPGMSTIGFTKYFKKVIGVDVSETQIACAPKNIPNCEFKVGYSDKLPFIESGSADLFCCGASFHWMPQEETFAEADRILRPGGSIAIFDHVVPSSDIPEVQACFEKYWKKLFPFYPKEATHAIDGFHDLKMPYPGWIRNDEITLSMKYTVQQYVDFMKSTWVCRAYRDAYPDDDILTNLARELTEVLAKSEAGSEYTVTWPVFILMAHKPNH
ncbi:hypothetical protein RRG08_039317 [Elysia crispata]|uniref:Methyltransferase type 11 domain-containing protein n=1 Tax=Elysia crispata TaxID=231223 RepID=A0AAE1D3U2_9GAST|nr:hypothetical protein RRG08_039317 [Elysia crispata]